MLVPSVGRIVHYVSHGTPGGEYGKECRAAIVTDLTGDPDNPGRLALAVLNPTGMFFNTTVDQHEAPPAGPHSPTPGAWSHPGGTWHWPERS